MQIAVRCLRHRFVKEKENQYSTYFIGAPRSMKIGTIASLWRYDAATRHALQPVNPGLPAILRYACK
jgi:hypothetical protein